jgi:hypothetical protein
MKPIIFFVVSFLGMLFIAFQTSKQRSMVSTPPSEGPRMEGASPAEEGASTPTDETVSQESMKKAADGEPPMKESAEAIPSPEEGPKGELAPPLKEEAADDKGAMEDKWLRELGATLRRRLPAGVELVPRQTKNYVAVTLDDNPRRWVYRLYMKTTSHAIEIFGRKKKALGPKDAPERFEKQVLDALEKRLA